MERQISFAHAEFAGKKRTTRREKFLAEMEVVVPWARLVALIEPHYPRGQRGRPPIGIERMLRIYFLSQWYGLADEHLEETIYDSQAMRAFAGIDLSVQSVPDATTLLKFRRLLEEHRLTKAILDEVNVHLSEQKLTLREGTIVDATIIAAPPSTKNRERKRDPEMHQTKKGNTWHFGMKAHIGVDDSSGIVHTVCGTAANVADVAEAAALLHGGEKRVFADAGYIGAQKRPEAAAKAGGATWYVAAKRGAVKAMAEGPLKAATVAFEKAKAGVRALVEHPFHIVKNLFKHRKVRYRGLAKNTAQLETLFALANLVIAKRSLLSACRA